MIRQNRDQATQTLCFSSRPFVLCGLPVRQLPKDQLLYERRNGRFVLQVTGHPFLATLAVQQKSQTIRFRTAAEMLETFGMQTGGKEYRRLVDAFERVFGATIFFARIISSAFANVIVLSDDFYQEILAHLVPNDLEAVKLLAAAPAVLDLYMWLSAIRAIWPECPARIASDSQSIELRKAAAVCQSEERVQPGG